MTDRNDALARIATIASEEQELSFSSFTHDDAWQLGITLREIAVARDLPVAINIRLGEQQVFQAARAGSSADNDDWIARKVRTALRFGRASFTVELDEGIDWLDERLYARAGGSVPIRVNGAIVGVVSVSGLTGELDHALVIEGMRAAHSR